MEAYNFLEHDFSQQPPRNLLDLKTDLRATLKNEYCLSISEPVKHTIACIDSELKSRGIYSLKIKK